MLRIFKRNRKTDTDALKTVFTGKYEAFKSLLQENNTVLEIMADLEEKSSGEYLFDDAYIHSSAARIRGGVGRIVHDLNLLSGGRYSLLNESLDTINKAIDRVLVSRTEDAEMPLVLSLESVDASMADVVGGKMANLGELKNRCMMPVPDGFVLTTAAFRKFISMNRLAERLKELLRDLNLKDLNAVEVRSEEFRQMVTQAPLPDEILSAIKEACLKLASGGPDGLSLSVRSSAPSEDGHFSFAGQYASYLNVKPDAVADRYREVLASLFTPRALFYSLSRGFDDKDMVMAVGVMLMVQAVSGGVLYTGDPIGDHAGCMTINGAWGLASLVVDGTGKTDQFIVESSTGKIIEQTLADKQGMVVADEKGGVGLVAVPEAERLQASLTNDQIGLLAEYGRRLEEHFGKPQDIEWSVGPDGRLFLLQSRPLRVPRQEARKSLPRRIPGQNILIDKGVIASRGVGFGPVFRVSNESDLSMFPQGAVLVARTTSTRYVAVMDRVAAIVTDIGGATGHMASIAREYRVPAILDTDIATRKLSDGQLITVDAINCNVYEGRVEELIEYESGRIEPIRETRLLQRLGQFMQVVAPLNLTDPDRDDFRPEACHTLHDITRFAHEKAMTEMFGLSDTDTAEGAATVTLNAGIPIDAHMIDVGGGIREGMEKALPEDILSIPCRAFLKGLTAMKWPEPRTADMGGFFGMMAHAASIPEEQLQQTAIRSFALLSSSYMNFSIRLGYHFSMVEAFAGETLNDNYVKFFFKGGGAARDRRLRRVRLIAELLRKIDFRVTVTDDVINASLMKFRQSSIEARLEALGRMTVFTKQLDMAMYNDDITDWYRDEFVRDHLEPVIGDTL